jgi:L-fuconolactonase
MPMDLVAADVFDGQAHIWADASPERPWQPEWYDRAHRFPALGGEELLGMMDAAGVGRAVLVQPSWAGDDNDVVLEAVERHPDRFVAMARVPVEQAAGEPMLDGLAAHPGVYGVRLTFHRPEMQAWLVDGTADWLWPALAERGLVAMVYAPGRNAKLERIARRHPGLRLAVDTLGLTLTMRDGEIDAPIRDLAMFADVPNVVVKATALPGYVADDYPFASLAPRLRWLVDVLGKDRVLWASDLTRVPRPYRQLVTFAGDLGVLSDDELAAFMGRNLASWLACDRPIPTTPGR